MGGVEPDAVIFFTVCVPIVVVGEDFSSGQVGEQNKRRPKTISSVVSRLYPILDTNGAVSGILR